MTHGRVKIMIEINRELKISLYQQIYENIKRDIFTGRLCMGEKLTSKRRLAEQLGVSLITVENAYAQLIAEGYVRAAEKSGYFVQYNGEIIPLSRLSGNTCFDEAARNENDSHLKGGSRLGEKAAEKDESAAPTITESAECFPFTVWARLMRSVLLEKGTALLQPIPNGGAVELRSAVSDYLYRVRGFYVPSERIIIGSGTEYLYNLLIQLLGREHSYGTENPGYRKPTEIYRLNDVRSELIAMDDCGMDVKALEESGVSVAHISPAHHFPTGTVMPISRRREIITWAKSGRKERFIIEDDYDSEFRWSGRPLPAMFGMDDGGRVIYVNTFSQTIAPSVRISYMCLPEGLYERWQERMGFYSCSVPAFEQYTLARFISEGYFERHINRSKKRYRRIRELVLELMESFGDSVTVNEENAGLHFTIKTDNTEVREKCALCGITIRSIREYYGNDTTPADSEQVYVVNYSNASEKRLMSILN